MGSSKWRSVLTAVLLMLFLSGLAVLLYPYAYGAVTDHSIGAEASAFLEKTETPTAPQPLPWLPTEPVATQPEETGPQQYPELWEAMGQYNDLIHAQGQSGLSCEYDYQQPSFQLSDYGLDSEVFGVISIPAVEIEMPIYLGATNQHMADGAAHLSQTSLPIGGINTNSVIAGHRGYGGASYFRYIDQLQVGDEVVITNLWETLTYRVVETKIIYPHEVGEILIQPGRELLTLLTCHPYASGGRQRYLVFCERVIPSIPNN